MATSRWGALRSVLFGSVAVLSINAAAAAQQSANISLQEQPLSDALRSVAQKTGESILFTPESVEGLKAPAISGQMDAKQAVSMLTRGTDLEALATTGAEDVSGGSNRGRSFDFNVFASELFSQLTVHKTASAEVEEGSLGATVDLFTAHPFDKPGFTLVTSGQAGYNDASGAF